MYFLYYRESQKTWDLEDELGTFLTGISEIMKGHSINPNMEKITVMLLEFYWTL